MYIRFSYNFFRLKPISMKIPKELESLGVNKSQVISCIVGGNSKVFKIWENNNRFRAYKLYMGDMGRVSKMYAREKAAINFLSGNGINCIPQNSQFFPEFNINSYDWIDGVNPVQSFETLQVIFHMLGQLNNISRLNYNFEAAVDKVFNMEDLLNQFPNRISKLGLFPEKYKFLAQLDKRIQKFKSLYVKDIFTFARTLSLSDIGVHNIISSGDTYTFIDFEFFGYDSTAKMMGDFLLHPKNKFLSQDITKMQQNLFFNSALNLELKCMIPLLSLKWSLISAGQIAKFQVGESGNDFDIKQVESRSYNYLKYFDYSLEETGDLMSYNEFVNSAGEDF